MLKRICGAPVQLRLLGLMSVLVLAACSGDSTSPRVAVAIVNVSNPVLLATVGTAISPAPRIEIRDAAGDPISGVSFSVSVSAGGGTIVGAPARTTSESTNLGTWTLGTTAGAQSLTITSGSLTPLVISATSTAGVATTSASGGGPLTAGGTVGSASVISPSIRLTDAFGNNVPNVGVTTVVSGGGSIATPNPTTNVSGIASVGTWTLGPAAGNQSVTLSAAGVAPVTFLVLAAAGPAANVVANSVTTGNGTPGTLAPYQPSIRVTDAFGNGIPGAVVATTVSAGGSIQITAPVTNGFGIASVGTWTTAVAAGENTVTMTASSLPAVAFTVTTTGTAPPASFTTVAGSFQTAAPGAALATAPVFRVFDVNSDPIPGATVQFEILSGGGSVSTLSAVTDAQGDASPGTWTLGSTFGAQRLRASIGGLSQTLYATALAPASGTYDIEIRYLGTPPSAAVQAAFNAAKARIQALIVGDLPAHSVNVNIAGCITGGPVVSEVIDDLVLYVLVRPIDGQFGTLGQAGPCWPLPPFSPRLPSIGIMELDEADVADLLTFGILESTILHEMHHVLGFGFWPFFQVPLMQGAGTTNPIYLGAAGNASYFANGGTFASGLRIHNADGPGSADAHWRESLFGNELMTAEADLSMPLSAFTIMSLADFGYSVSTAGADPYTIPNGALRTLSDLARVARREILLRATPGVDAEGRPMPVAPRLPAPRR